MKTICLIIAGLLIAGPAVSADPPPKLVLQITVDQLRGDQLTRYRERFGEGGFRYLMEQGVHFTNANYQHANTETIVGHASLATGAMPATHGMVANVWFDHELGRLVYNIEDPRYHLLSADADVDKSTEIDHTQMAAKSDGRSPSAILTSTLSDEMAIHFGGHSKIFGVSVKDRGAVAMAGHAGKAFWFSKASGAFVTSNYYYDHYPEWVTAWNSAKPVEQFSGTSWSLLHDQASYLFGTDDNRPYETSFPGYGRVFPHSYGTADDKYFTTRLTLGPAGDRLTLKFARELINQENLGKDKIPDYLAVSFSTTDYVGHIFGPSSLEMEDNLLHLDRTIADLLRYVDDEVGLDQTLIVLSADHGAPEAPGYLNELGITEAHYFEPDKMDKSPIMTRLKERFGIGSELITQYFHPYVYLNRQLITEMGLDQAEIEQAVANELVKYKGISVAVSSTVLARNEQPDTPLMQKVLNNFNQKRSGDIYIVFEPNVFIHDFEGLTVASTHGSPWNYDTYVPVIFAGHGIEAKKVVRPITPYDIAPTIAARLGIKPPSGSVGQPLPEVLEH